jgi:single-strand DNA-binding protein
MATTFNKIILVGHLSRDPALRYTPTGTAIATFSLATNHRYKTGETWHEEACFLDVVVFGRQAEPVGDYLHKGSQAIIEGRLRQRTWETADGQKRHKHEVVADRVHFLGVRTQDAEAEMPPVDADELANDDTNIPF